MQNNNELNNFKISLKSGFFGFWIKNYKFVYLLIVVIIFMGIYNLITIPKESTPDISIGYVSVNTIYRGASPNDVYDLVTKEIESNISNLNGIKEITSNSTLGFSSVFVQIDDSYDEQEVFLNIRDEVDKINLPQDSENPIISRISSANNLVYQIILFNKDNKYSQIQLGQKAEEIKNYIEGNFGISKVNIGATGGSNIEEIGGSSSGSDFEYQIILDNKKIDNLGINLSQVSDIIRSYNKNFPLGNHKVGILSYDFRIESEAKNIAEIMDLPIRTNNGSMVKISDIAIWDIVPKDDTISRIGFNNYNKDFNYIILSFDKSSKSSIFSSSRDSKKALEDIFQKPGFQDLEYKYTMDLAGMIIDDYGILSESAIQTIILVFITLLVFIGLKQALMATVALPLAFLITFIILNYMGLSLNFLTNFSLVLSLGIAIDTIIVITEGATAKKRLGYHSKYAILLAIKELRAPLIAGASTTMVAFLPMIMLPGIMGKFLSYIPITVFLSLLAALIISLTLNSSLFYRFNRNYNFFTKDKGLEQFLSQEEKLLLEEHRLKKIEHKKEEEDKISDKIFDKIQNLYSSFLEIFLKNRFTRLLTIFSPIILLIFTFVFLAPKIGFTIFPSTDEDYIDFTIESQVGTITDEMFQYVNNFDTLFNDIKEIDHYYYNIKNNSISLHFTLIPSKERQSIGMRNVFDIEKEVSNKLIFLQSKGLSVRSKIMQSGPPQESAVGIRLISQDARNLDILKEISKDFEDFLENIDGVRAVFTTAKDTPGQFLFTYKKDIISKMGLNPQIVSQEIYSNINGLRSGSMRQSGYDRDIILKNSQFENGFYLDDIKNIPIKHQGQIVYAGELIDSIITPSISSISTKDGKISLGVNADLFKEYESETALIQKQLLDFASGYIFPAGISFEAAGEQQENMELIVGTLVAFVITLILMFAILVLQFKSFAQPFMILYSIVLALLGVNIGLWITGNPYSMTFAIGFIALTGIVVNNAIILIDRINSNLKSDINKKQVVLESSKSRLRPIILTTFTTIFGILPLSLQDEFWAGLGFTVIFGLSAGALMTLFVIPCIYYEVFLRDKKRSISIFKRLFLYLKAGK